MISPLLFLCMINDIFDDLGEQVTTAMCADYCTLWTSHENIHMAIDILQTAINRIMEWSNKNGLNFSPDKSQVMVFKRNMKLPVHGPLRQIQMGDAPIGFVREVRFLGILLGEKLSMENHSKYIKTKGLEVGL